MLWLLATALVAAAPIAYFVSGSSDSTTETSRIAFAAIPLIVAWFPLVGSVALVHRRFGTAGRRATVLLLAAAGMLAISRSIGTAGTIHGDGAWTAYWLACATAWTVTWRAGAGGGPQSGA